VVDGPPAGRKARGVEAGVARSPMSMPVATERYLSLLPGDVRGHGLQPQSDGQITTFSGTCRLNAAAVCFVSLVILGAFGYLGLLVIQSIPVAGGRAPDLIEAVLLLVCAAVCGVALLSLSASFRMFTWSPRLEINLKDGSVTYIGPWRDSVSWSAPISEVELVTVERRVFVHRSEHGSAHSGSTWDGKRWTSAVLVVAPKPCDSWEAPRRPFVLHWGRVVGTDPPVSDFDVTAERYADQFGIPHRMERRCTLRSYF
jgi:hypothetical protein